MSCAKQDAMLSAVHGGEPADADCAECAEALADERAFVATIERGLAGVRPMTSIAQAVRARLKPRTVKRYRPRRSAVPFIAAAAAVVAAVIATVVAMRPREEAPPGDIVRESPRAPETREVRPPPPTPAPDLPKPEAPPPETPKPEPGVSEPPRGGMSNPPQPEPRPEPPKTVPEPARAEVAVIVRSGALTVAGRKLPAGAVALPVGGEFRAQGRTRVEFAGGAIHFDANARGRFDAANAISLADGEMFVDVPAAAAPELRLAATVTPIAGPGRFIAVARPDRIAIDEGAAMCGERLLAEDRQYRLGREVAVEKRTLVAPRAKETSVWKADFDRAKAPPNMKVEGVFVAGALRSRRERDNAFCAGRIYVQAEDLKFLVAKPATHLRFRYLMRKSAPILVQSQNVTKSENFQLPIERPVVGEWTTVTLRVMDLRVNPGGQAGLKVEPGDQFSWISWMVGRPGEDVDVTIDDVEILEITR